METIKTITAILTGGVLWEGFKFLYPDLKRIIESRINAKNILNKNIDPLLKSASELYGKIESLAKEDFASFINPEKSNSVNPEHNKKYVMFLFSQFWGNLEYLRLENQYTSLAKLDKGKNLLRFIETIESRKFRILDRSIQRIIGEGMISEPNAKFNILTLKEFIEKNNSDENFSIWIDKLDEALTETKEKNQRQKILVFGIITALIIDYFDPDYKVARRRGIYSNKLSKRSKKLIQNDLSKHYLPFIKTKLKYF
ncbi:hypothetical protein [Polaribacter staleyi]|uniref:hypothetical protein n=1 Tax=Polaribacter staleyi TaxID=2022337 RepID=UPI0031BA4639